MQPARISIPQQVLRVLEFDLSPSLEGTFETDKKFIQPCFELGFYRNPVSYELVVCSAENKGCESRYHVAQLMI